MPSCGHWQSGRGSPRGDRTRCTDAHSTGKLTPREGAELPRKRKPTPESRCGIVGCDVGSRRCQRSPRRVARKTIRSAPSSPKWACRVPVRTREMAAIARRGGRFRERWIFVDIAGPSRASKGEGSAIRSCELRETDRSSTCPLLRRRQRRECRGALDRSDIERSTRACARRLASWKTARNTPSRPRAATRKRNARRKLEKVGAALKRRNPPLGRLIPRARAPAEVVMLTMSRRCTSPTSPSTALPTRHARSVEALASARARPSSPLRGARGKIADLEPGQRVWPTWADGSGLERVIHAATSSRA